MKKSLIALAVIAASGSAMAQSSVTLYGLIDVSVQSFKAKVFSAGTATTAETYTNLAQTRMQSGAQNGSRWGMKGVEDLGGGLNAVFDLQSGFNVDTGASGQDGLLFGRHAFVGLNGGFGTLTLGRHDTSLDDEIGNFLPSAHNAIDVTNGVLTNHAANAFPNATAASTIAANAQAVAASAGVGVTNAALVTLQNNAAKTVGAWVGYNSRVDNSIKFNTANYAGFTGSVTYGLGENKTATVGATSTFSLTGKYSNGPIGVLVAYQDEVLAKAATGNTDLKNTMVAATYDFGVAKLYGAYNQAKLSFPTLVRKNNEYALGVTAPVGAFTLRAEYAQSKGDVFSGLTNTDVTAKGFDLEALYDLSKRTTLYTSYAATKHDKNVSDSKTSVFAAGIRHRF